MEVITDWEIPLNVEQVLRAQGSDPAVIQNRSPQITALAERALREGTPLLEPAVVFQDYRIRGINHERVLLSEGAYLAGKGVAGLLAPAKKLAVVVCTIGLTLETYLSAILHADPGFGLALDGLGTAAVEALAVNACSYLGEGVAKDGMQATLPFSPGMEGWPAGRGQEQVFRLVDAERIGVRLNESGAMTPQKTLSFVIGFGPDVESGGRVCDYCSMRLSCRHQDHYN
jgi:hypothetical protein